MNNIRENLLEVRERVKEAAFRASKNPDNIKIVAVTKTVPTEKIKEALEVGVKAIGENRIQDAQQKYQDLGRVAEWHMIGHLQSNKAKRAVEIFDLIHSVDSLNLAKKISKYAIEIGKVQDILIQVNVSGEESKFGICPQELMELLVPASKLSGVRVKGLMTVAPMSDNMDNVRPYFAQLRELAQDVIKEQFPGVSMDYLSMGMSGDYEVAIEEGANIVRIGTAIFGSRKYND